MNKHLMKQAGFEKEMELAEQTLCPFCQASIDEKTDFRDDLSRQEYGISGLCQTCQDDFFDSKEE